jgi:large subunit ribosomal protein L35
MAKMKLKTKRAAAKRFKITASGKITFKKSGLIHKLSKKSRVGKRKKHVDGVVTHADHNLVMRCFPYGLN